MANWQEIDALLPQTQCGKCDYDDCQTYAQNILNGEKINKCPPGGELTVKKIADLLNLAYLPLQETAQTPQVAKIRLNECIGCTKCLAVCPTDAIIGAGKLLHIVIESACSGCELCISPCPVDCIDIIELANPLTLLQRAQIFRPRYVAHQARKRQLSKTKTNNKIQNLSRQDSNANTTNKHQKLQRNLSRLQTTLTKTNKQQQIYASEKLAKQILILQQEISKIKQLLN